MTIISTTVGKDPLDLAPLSMGFPQVRILGNCHFLLRWGGLTKPGIEPTPLMSPDLVGGFFTTNAIWE